MFTWLPYSLVLIYSTLKDSSADDIPPLFSTLATVFASSSSVWSTLLYLVSNKHIKAKLTFDLILCKNPDYEIFNMNVNLLFIHNKSIISICYFVFNFWKGNIQWRHLKAERKWERSKTTDYSNILIQFFVAFL